eukprot:CAMPEP_0181048144 /NCGR_PEP_ID=MMETSP1070-20121207/15273_1 /TAXON_ID=265543 /ORGANISM="Minutocellus polymorphus, Strain NH13" /LENGTH=970 /DNA_ID=CAMNT_0023126897 /DNA_START=242 /DNA_END=3152 /DNA_ORIENTATION=+
MDGFSWMGPPAGGAGESQSQSRRPSDGYGYGGAGAGSGGGGGGGGGNNAGTGAGGQQQQGNHFGGSINSNLAAGGAMGAAGGYDPLLGMLDFGVGMGGGGLGLGAPQANPFGDPFAAAPPNLYGGGASGLGGGGGGGYRQMQPSQLGGTAAANGVSIGFGANGGSGTAAGTGTGTGTGFDDFAMLFGPPAGTTAGGGLGGDLGANAYQQHQAQHHQQLMQQQQHLLVQQQQQLIQAQNRALAQQQSRRRKSPSTQQHQHRSGHGQQQRAPSSLASSSMQSSLFDPIDVFSSSRPSQKAKPNAAILSASKSATPLPVAELGENDDLLNTFTMHVENLSAEDMTAKQVLDKINTRTDEVITLFLPCCDFLVQCQQELRAGLAVATKKRYTSRGGYQNSMTNRQFYNTYIAPLPGKFLRQNQPIMPTAAIQSALKGVQNLCADAKRAERSGCEAMKNTFLGGMREGQSWGLRKWLSTNGGALAICNDLELIMGALRKLDKSAPSTIRLAEIVRPRAQLVFDRLKADVPKAYQEHSSAHPYLPFFHRLEGVLKGLATFDPTDDDVVCLDDSDDEDDIKPTPVKSESGAGIVPTGTTPGATPGATPGLGSKRPSVSATSDDSSMMDTSTAKRMKREGSDLSGFSGFNQAFGNALEKLADESDTGGTGISGQSSTPGQKLEIETVDLLDSSDEEDEADCKPSAAPAGAPTSESVFESKPAPPAAVKPQAPSPTTGASKGWRCPQCTYLNDASAKKCAMCEDDDDEDFDSDVLLQALLNGTFANDVGPSASANSANSTMGGSGATAARGTNAASTASHTADSLGTKLDAIVTGFGSNMHYMLRPCEVDTTAEHWNAEHNYVWALKFLKMILQRSESRSLINPADETALFLAGLPSYSSIIRHPVCFADIVEALATPKSAGSHLWGDGKVSSLPKRNLWQGKDLLEAIDMVMLNALAYFGDQDNDKKATAQKLRTYFW